MNTSTYRCFACMQPVDSLEAVCPHCGYDNHVRDNGPGFLPEILLQNQYLVGKMLGRGGFGVTYIGYDINLDQTVAVKEYFPGGLATRDSKSAALSAYADSIQTFKNGCERAMREGRTAARVRRIPGIVQIYNVLSCNNTVYIVMEYVDGQTLSAYVKEHGGKLAFSEALELLGPIAVALDKLHEAGVVHRDVKPENIMVRRGTKETVLLDFGAARVLDNRTMSLSSQIYTVGYAPPEQCSTAAAIDARLDQYAFCGTLYYVLTGEVPLDCQLRLFTSQEMKPIRELNDSVPGQAEAAIMKGMSLKPEGRYASMRELMQAIEAGSAKPVKTGSPAKTPGAARKGSRKGPVIAVCAALLAGGTLWVANGLKDNGEMQPFAATPTSIPVSTSTLTPTPTSTHATTSTGEAYTVKGFDKFTVYIDVEDGKIVSVSVPEHNETPGFGADLIANASVFDALVGQDIATAQIDVRSGVTLTSNAINDALRQATIANGFTPRAADSESVIAGEAYTVKGFDKFTVYIDVEDGKIVSVNVPEHNETPGYGADLIEDDSVFDGLVGQGIATAQIDVRSGVTLTSNAINDALRQAAEHENRR